MSKILIIFGLIMMSIGFARVANAQEQISLVAKQNIVLAAKSNILVVAPGCELEYKAKNFDRKIEQGATLSITEIFRPGVYISTKYKGPMFYTSMFVESDSTKEVYNILCITKENVSAKEILKLFNRDSSLMSLRKSTQNNETLETSAEGSL